MVGGGKMKVKESRASRLFDVANILFMIFIMVIMAYPVYYVVIASISDSNALLAHRGVLLKPIGLNLSAYSAVFKNPNIVTGYAVTLFVVIVGTFLDIAFTSLSAFVLSRKGFKLNKILMPLIVFTMYFSGGMIPRYLFISQTLHLSNNIWALILPGVISTWNLIIMRTNFESIPASLEEATKIDGGNDLVVLLRIVLPLSKAVIAVMVLMYAVGRWNAWFDAMIFIRDRNMYPLQIILREILISNSTTNMAGNVGGDVQAIGESIKYATIVVSTLPVMCVYPFIQKYFQEGIMMGAVKG